jgi:hypothetical protein
MYAVAVTRLRALVLVLRFSGAVLLLAFLAVLLPADWMAVTHRWLGMGEFPRTAVVDYLVRSIAALYGFHGVLVLLVSRDPVRYLSIVRYLGVMDVVFGGLMIAIDLHAGMPALWTAAEGPPLIGVGLLVLALSRIEITNPSR